MGVLKAKCCLYFALQSDSVLALTGAETLWSPVQQLRGEAFGWGWLEEQVGDPGSLGDLRYPQLELVL